MSTLYLDLQDMKLSHQKARLIINSQGNPQQSYPFSHFERIIVTSRATVTTGLLGALAEAGIGLLVLAGRGQRRPAILLGSPPGDTLRRIRQVECYLDHDIRRRWAIRTVRAKIIGQRRVLLHIRCQRPDIRRELTRGINTTKGILEQLKENQMQTLDQIRGLEGAAAASYFPALGSAFAPSLGFTKRSRRPPKDPVNASLSLGYMLLFNDAANACRPVGLDPMIGLFHDLTHGRDSLAADLVEPFRPVLDRWVWEKFRKEELRADHFQNLSEYGFRLGKRGSEIYFGSIHKLQNTIRPEMIRTLRSAIAASTIELGIQDQELFDEDPIY